MASALAPLEPPDGDLDRLASAVGARSPRALRLNPLGRTGQAEDVPFAGRRVPWYPSLGRIVEGTRRPAGYIQFAMGDYYVQDAGSLLPIAAMHVPPDGLICDLCASPGGKATALLERLGEAGGLLANEVIGSRIGSLRLNLARHGGTRYIITRADPTDMAGRCAEHFDAVLVDAPCSGQSLLGRRQQTARAFAKKTVAHCAARQRRILDAAVRLVRPGGSLVYATCTFSWNENEQQILDLLDRHADWSIEPVESLTSWQSPSPAPQGCYRLWPHLHESAGAFACRLRRGKSTAPHRPSGRKRSATGRPRARVGTWRPDVIVRTGPSRTEVWPDDVPDLLTTADGFGPEAEFRKGKTWLPAYALAMRRDGRFTPDQAVELDPEQAARYVRGESVRHGALGWVVVTFQSRPLGWARGSGRQLANHMPAGARIRDPIVEPETSG